MNSQKRIFSLRSLASILLICTASAFGQGEAKLQAEPNYDAILHVVASSSEPGPAEALPQSLSSVSKQLRNDFGAANLKLLNTYVGRMTNSGSLEYKGVSNAYAPAPESDALTFLEWNLTGLKNLQNAAGQNAFQFQTFRFGARVPIKVLNYRDETGKVPAVYNYESIGLTLSRMSVLENVPTLIGTLSRPRTNGTLFLILTVKNAAK
ncbi:MAG: hypothetical protein WBD27_06510 [Pyrinomonadaceae bacterium]